MSDKTATESTVVDSKTDQPGGVQTTQTVPTPPDTGQGKKLGGDDTIVLTPAQLAERLQRKEETAVSALLKELGVENVDGLKGALSDLKSLRDAQLSDEERKNKAIEEAAKRVKELEDRAAAATAQALNNELRLKAFEIMSGAEQPFTDPVAALRLIDLTNVVQDGAVNVDALKEAIKQAATAYPWALKKGTVTTPPSGATSPGQAPQGESDDAKRARYFGGARTASEFFGAGGGVIHPE